MLLTVNRDKLFIPKKPPGARSTIFRLSFEPCNLEKAIEQYNEWNKLLKGDWWWTFSKKRNYGFNPEEDIDEIDNKNISKKKNKKRKRKGKMSPNHRKKIKIDDNKNSIDEGSISINESNSVDEYGTNNESNNEHSTNNENNSKYDKINEDSYSGEHDNKDKENLDDEFIPSSLDEIVEVKKSTVNIKIQKYIKILI